MTTRGLPRTQPYGGIVPFGTTETSGDGIQNFLAEFNVLHAVLRIVGNGSEILAGVVAGILQDVADCIYI